MIPKRRLKELMIRGMNRAMPTCEDISHLVSAGMDEELAFGDRMKIRVHLAMCRWCRRFETQLRLLRQVAHDVANDSDRPTAVALSPAAKSRLQSAMAKRGLD